MKKIISIVLAMLLVLSSVAAFADGFTPAASYDPGERNFDGGEITTVPAAAPHLNSGRTTSNPSAPRAC